MENIFENAYFGKAYKTRDGKKALFSRKDGDTFDLETEECYNPVRSDGSFLFTKEGYESCGDIISEWEDDKTDCLTMFTSLPHLDDNKKIVDDWGYTPNLYHFDTKWHVSWIHCSEGDSLVDFMGDSPEEAITKAYNFISELRK